MRDELGSVRELTDSTGAVRARYDYDPYGKRTKLSGDLDAQFDYTGFYYHAPSEMNLALYRAYDWLTGRWLSRDPIAEAGGINLYGYVSNNPTNRRDLFGLQTLNQSPLDPEWQELDGYTPEAAQQEIQRTRELRQAGWECYRDTSLMSLKMLKCAAMGKPMIDQLVDKIEGRLPDAILEILKRLLARPEPQIPPNTSPRK